MKKVTMLDSTFDSNKKKLPRGAEFKVTKEGKKPDEISSSDAELLVKKGKAEEVKN